MQILVSFTFLGLRTSFPIQKFFLCTSEADGRTQVQNYLKKLGNQVNYLEKVPICSYESKSGKISTFYMALSEVQKAA